MPASTNEGWQELQLPSRKECPKLFYSFSTPKDSFTLLLTDLISIWDCSLDKYDILAEAARQHASIDPSESTAQFEVLLSKLRQSLVDGQNVLVRDKSHTFQDLILRTHVNLPRPLKPLEWTFRLSHQNASELAERLLRPSLHEVSISQDKISSLLRIVKEKDHVISRLLDRIGNSGVDLGLIFPGISGASSRKGGQLSAGEAKKHVAGMAGFDEKSWMKEFSNDDGYEGADRTGLKNLVSGCEKCFVHSREQHEDWLNALSTSDRLEHKGNQAKTRPQQSEAKINRVLSDSGEGSTDSDNDFERQPTPPGLKSKSAEAKKTSAPAPDADDEPPSKKAKTFKIGGLGRRNATKAYGDSTKRPKSSSSTSQTSSPPPRRPFSPSASAASETGTATGTESESETEAHPRNASSQKQKQNSEDRENQSKQKSNVGALSKRPDKSPLSTHSAADGNLKSESPSEPRPRTRQRTKTPQPDPTSSSTPSSRHRLGRLNKKQESPRPSEKSASSTPEPDDDLDASPPPPRTRSSQAPTESQTTPSRRLGRLGGRKQQQEARSSPQSSSKKQTKAPVRSRRDDEDVEMKDTDDHDATPSPSPSPKPSTRQSTTTTSPSIRPKRKAPASTPEEKEAEAKEEEETAEEKANRRRAELKRDIATGAGVKKKRRF